MPSLERVACAFCENVVLSRHDFPVQKVAQHYKTIVLPRNRRDIPICLGGFVTLGVLYGLRYVNCARLTALLQLLCEQAIAHGNALPSQQYS